MAEGGGTTTRVRKGRSAQPAPAPAPLELTAEDMLKRPLPDYMPSDMFTGPGLLQLADLMPVMTAFADTNLVIRFVNKPYAEWVGRPRKEILGRTMREIFPTVSCRPGGLGSPAAISCSTFSSCT